MSDKHNIVAEADQVDRIAVYALREAPATLTGEEMISAATGTLETLFALNPSAVGGALPGEDFWFGA